MVLPEIVAIGIYNSDIVAKNKVFSKKRKTSMFEIELPIENGGISYIESDLMNIEKDMIICAKPDQIRHTKFPFKCYFVHMIVHDDALYNILQETPDFFKIKNAEEYRKIFLKLIKHYNNPSKNDEIITQSLILQLIYMISKDNKGQINRKNTAGNYSVIEKALKYIKENLTEDLNLESVAKSASISPIYFHNTFKTAVGKTLREYVEEQRIKKSIKLLQTTNKTLTEIAYECGFSSQSYFSYVFKRRMKTTPREYIKNIYNAYEE